CSFSVAFALPPPACMLCHRTESDMDICGPRLNLPCISAHRFCLVSSSGAAFIFVCFVCGERGATITCDGVGCDRCFHLPCAMEGGCVTGYFIAFCWEHCPQQQELEAPEDTNCLICTDPLEGRTTYGTMVCPVCKHAWFHRACIQVGAIPLLRAQQPLSSTRCPLCQNKKLFLTEMLLMGIRIPVRRASWEDNNAYADLYQRHRSCNATECLCPEGREGAQPDGPWRLFLCRSCAAVGTHRCCSNLGNSHEATWECDSCAGLGTRKYRSRGQRRARAPYARPRRRSQDSRPAAARAGRSPHRQAEPRLAQGSRARGSRSRSTTRQRPSPSSRGSRARQRRSASRSTWR
uniref:Uncharacterized protein n=1 Tax=Melopsittacus undulatus TaxID=13146 RepID=A0A8C6IPH5_MELUD